MLDNLKDMAKLGIGAISLSRENLKKITDSFASAGKMSKEEGDRLFDEMADNADQFRTKLRETVDASVKNIVAQSGFATKKEIEELRLKISELEKKL